MADSTNATEGTQKYLKAEYKDLATSTKADSLVDGSALEKSRAQQIRSFGYQEETASSAKDWFSNLLTTDYFWNYNREPAPAFNFFLRIEGVFDAPCRSVRAFTRENDFEEIQEGGRNDYVILKRKPNARRFTLQVERYVGIDKVDPLQLGTEMVLPMLLAVSRVSSSKSGFADTLKETEFIRFYAFTGCIVTAKEYGELNAEQSGLLKEVTTIAYREMLAITNPNADLTNKTWDIKGWKENHTDSNARANDPFPDWNTTKAEPRLWKITEHEASKVDTSKDMRSAARPVADSEKSAVKLKNEFNKFETDKPEAKMYDVRDKKSPHMADVPPNDKKRSKKALFKIKDKYHNRSADAPNDDEKRARVKAYTVKLRKSMRSATLPAQDVNKAVRLSYTIKKKKSSLSAITPGQDKLRAERKLWDIRNPEKNRSAVVIKGAADVSKFLSGGK